MVIRLTVRYKVKLSSSRATCRKAIRIGHLLYQTSLPSHSQPLDVCPWIHIRLAHLSGLLDRESSWLDYRPAGSPKSLSLKELEPNPLMTPSGGPSASRHSFMGKIAKRARA